MQHAFDGQAHKINSGKLIKAFFAKSEVLVQMVHLVECCSVKFYLVTHNFLGYVGELGN